MTSNDLKKALDLWAEMFTGDDVIDVVRAVKELICELEFPPTIADVKKKVNKYVDERRFIEYVKKQEELEAKERLMLEEKYGGKK